MFFFPLKLLMIGFFERFIKETINTFENTIHDWEVVQLNMFSESYSQIDFNFVYEVLNTFHYKVGSLTEFCKALDSGTQLYLITF